jgi:hypothetical protein
LSHSKPVKNTLTSPDFSIYSEKKVPHKAPQHHHLFILTAVQIKILFTRICEVNISLLSKVICLAKNLVEVIAEQIIFFND